MGLFGFFLFCFVFFSFSWKNQQCNCEFTCGLSGWRLWLGWQRRPFGSYDCRGELHAYAWPSWANILAEKWVDRIIQATEKWKFPGSPWLPKGGTPASSNPDEIAIRQTGSLPQGHAHVWGQTGRQSASNLLCTEEPQSQSIRCYLVLGVAKVRSAETWRVSSAGTEKKGRLFQTEQRACLEALNSTYFGGSERTLSWLKLESEGRVKQDNFCTVPGML